MKKIKELKIEELKKLYNDNKDFQSVVFDRCYENNMYWQAEEFKLMGAEVFDYNDHYSSFFLSTPTIYGSKAPEKVAGKLDADYMTEENAKLYKKLCELNAKMEDAEEWDEDREEYAEMTRVCDELADGLTEQFRAYEDISDEQIDEELEAILDGDDYMGEWETDGEKIFETIIKTYK